MKEEDSILSTGELRLAPCQIAQQGLSCQGLILLTVLWGQGHEDKPPGRGVQRNCRAALGGGLFSLPAAAARPCLAPFLTWDFFFSGQKLYFVSRALDA